MNAPSTEGRIPKFSTRRERGATLIEAVLFTVIAFGLITGGVVFFEQAFMSARTSIRP